MGDIELTSADLDELERAFDDASPKEEIGAFLGTGAWASAGDVASFRRLISLARSGLEARKAEESMRERAAKVAEKEQAVRIANGNAAKDGDTSWGPDTNAAAMAQYNKAITAAHLATAIRALPLTEGGDTP